MGKIKFLIKKGLQIFAVFFAIIFELGFIFTAPIAVMEIMHSENDSYYWLYFISIPLGVAALIVTFAGIDWDELFDIDYY